MRRMWHIWPGQLWPASPSQEQQFLDDLLSAGVNPGRFTRDDVTALMSMLRCGSVLAEAKKFAPGLRLPALLGAYQRLESLRSNSAASWQHIVKQPSVAVWKSNSKSAAKLFPVMIRRINTAWLSDPSAARLTELVADANERVVSVTQVAEQLENACVVSPRSQTSISSSMLFASTGPCLYANPFFLPSRIAALSPVRVGDLLGERRQ